MATPLEQRLWVGFLEIASADLCRRNVRGDDKDRHAGAVAIKQTIDEVQVAGSAAAGADRKIAGQMRLGSRRKGRDLFVPHVDPFDLALAS
jgi:hypothetical protein